jgi:hypothetical protein
MTEMQLALIDNNALRAAIQCNLVSFPAQIPAFMKGGDKQQRIVQLYFVRGWQTRAICDRYRLSIWAVRTSLTKWKIRAVAAGYIQDIHPGVLALLAAEAGEKAPVWPEEFGQSTPDSDFTVSESVGEIALPRQPAPVASIGVRL